MLTEADGPRPRAGRCSTRQVGFAVRRFCPPLLDLPALADPDVYLARRAELGVEEVNRRFLSAAGRDRRLCVDTGFRPTGDPAGRARRRWPARPRTRSSGWSRSPRRCCGRPPRRFVDALRAALVARARHAVGFKSIAAYRIGLDLDRGPDRGHGAAEARLAATPGADGRGAAPRLGRPDAAPLPHLVRRWTSGCRSSSTSGYGDRDVDLHRCDPLLLTPLLRAIEPTGVPIMLLHNYPFHRNAGYLAQVFAHVFVDVGLATHNVGAAGPALLAEALELAPFGKFLFSSDAFGAARAVLPGRGAVPPRAVGVPAPPGWRTSSTPSRPWCGWPACSVPITPSASTAWAIRCNARQIWSSAAPRPPAGPGPGRWRRATGRAGRGGTRTPGGGRTSGWP